MAMFIHVTWHKHIHRHNTGTWIEYLLRILVSGTYWIPLSVLELMVRVPWMRLADCILLSAYVYVWLRASFWCRYFGVWWAENNKTHILPHIHVPAVYQGPFSVYMSIAFISDVLRYVKCVKYMPMRRQSFQRLRTYSTVRTHVF